MSAPQSFPRQLLAFFILTAFLTFVLLLGISNEAADYARDLEESLVPSSKGKPDLNQYVRKKTLSDEELDFDAPNRRLLFVGDIHGMRVSLDKLLNKLHYNAEVDHLIHVGDIVAKGTLEGTLDVLTYVTTHNVTGVRGNHDQMVITWRAWIENVLSYPGGAKWLEESERKGKKELKSHLGDPKKILENGKEEGWKRFPDGLHFMREHYNIARKMTAEQAAYLRALPLVLHIPRLHTFVLHAGLLPIDPSRSPTSIRQPLSHVPEDDLKRKDKEEVQRLRKKQEEAILTDIPQNRDPWVLLNMRSIQSDNTITKSSKDGSAWAPLWNSIVSRCSGFDLELEDDNNEQGVDDFNLFKSTKKSREKPLPCYPSTVIYGHAASRGLDIRRWSKGLDTGCVYGRRLSALALTHPSSDAWVDDSLEIVDDIDRLDDADEEGEVGTESRKKKMRFGDAGEKTAKARVVSVSCPNV